MRHAKRLERRRRLVGRRGALVGAPVGEALLRRVHHRGLQRGDEGLDVERATSHEGSLDGMQRELERGRGGGQVGVAVGNGERRTQRRERLRAQKVDIERHGGELVGSQPRSARARRRGQREAVVLHVAATRHAPVVAVAIGVHDSRGRQQQTAEIRRHKQQRHVVDAAREEGKPAQHGAHLAR